MSKNLIKNFKAYFLLLLAVAAECSGQTVRIYEKVSPNRNDDVVKILLHRGNNASRYSDYKDWYLTKYLIELKGEQWYRDSVIKPLMNNRLCINGWVMLNRNGTFNIVRDQNISKSLKELCEYLVKNHKPLVFDYSTPPLLDPWIKRIANPDTLDCDSLRKFIRIENAVLFKVKNNEVRNVAHPVNTLGINNISIFKNINDADEILKLVKEKVSQCVDSYEAEALRQNACSELTNEDFIGVPTREEFVTAQKRYNYYYDPHCNIDSLKREELKFIDKFYKNKARRK